MLQLAAAVENLGKDKPEEKDLSLLAEAAGCIRDALEEHKLDASDVFLAVVGGERDIVTSAAQGLGLDPGLVWMLAIGMCSNRPLPHGAGNCRHWPKKSRGTGAHVIYADQTHHWLNFGGLLRTSI